MSAAPLNIDTSIQYLDYTAPGSPTIPHLPPRHPGRLNVGHFSHSARPHSSLGPDTQISPSPRQRLRNKHKTDIEDERRRDSGAPSSTTGLNTKELITATYFEESSAGGANSSILRQSPSLPTIVVDGDREQDDRPSEAQGERFGTISSASDGESAAMAHNSRQRESFHGITTSIPLGSLDDFMDPGTLAFSKRGTLLLNGERVNAAMEEQAHAKDGAGQAQDQSKLQTPKAIPRGRILSVDEAVLSQRVRTMYEHGDEKAAEWSLANGDSPGRALASRNSTLPDDNNDTLSVVSSNFPSRGLLHTASIVSSQRHSAIAKEEHEAAGGLEDWEDVEGGDVDRYGFIVPQRESSADPDRLTGTSSVEASPGRPGLQRVSTSLQQLSIQPRRDRTLRRTRSGATKPDFATTLRRQASRKSVNTRVSRQSGHSVSSTRTHSRIRYASNRLPYNRDRRLVEEASDMLTLPPGLSAIVEEQDDGHATLQAKRREWVREDKWRKMAKVIKSPDVRGRMSFDFDTRNPKLVERVWKGIPDRWRATAWFSFLHSEAKRKELVSDEELVAIFRSLQDQDCADDMQIDVDVPRTIGRHIMFRRRYRGGQRLLFRVLHAMSLYFPDTGYVQGMAALGATFLCYFDEESAFIMLVRMWQLRGLERLYQDGFAGLTEALDEFEKEWLAGNDVAKKLAELDIHPTSWGTRWYLTLFNYSIPFPAQLRVWDVFMLLGGSSDPTKPTEGNLAALHATSAAIIDATREVLLDSDFENAMKVLTSWIPVKDEDLLMKVAKTEWKAHKKRMAK